MATKARAKSKARKARKAATASTGPDEGPAGGAGSKAAGAAPKAKPSARQQSKKGRSAAGRATPARTSGRHTPPVSKKVRSSPRWMGVAIVACFVLGALVVIFDYVGLLPGGVNNVWLLAAIGAIFVGLLLATRYR